MGNGAEAAPCPAVLGLVIAIVVMRTVTVALSVSRLCARRPPKRRAGTDPCHLPLTREEGVV